MRYAAKVADGTVTQVIVGTPEWASERLGGEWVGSDTKVGVGWTAEDDGFRPPQPFPSWTWDGQAWVAPVPRPDEGWWTWDEDAQGWQALVEE